MSSKSDSARTNGAKSRGPSTVAGRARSSQNALKHGLCSQALLLPSEDPSEFHDLLTAYIQRLQPDGPVELDLVHEMVAAKWRLDRIALIETQLFADAIADEEDRADDPLTPTEALAGGFERLARGSSLNVLHRMESRLARAYSRALRNLLQLQKLRQPPAAPDPGPADAENKICKNEPTDPPTTGYLNAPDRSTAASPTVPAANLLKFPPTPGHLQSIRPATPSLLRTVRSAWS
jgi:hypothetical protein